MINPAGNTMRKYEGFWKDGKKNGPGSITFDDGTTFTGQVTSFTKLFFSLRL